MSTFPLDQMDEHLLKQIVRKFSPTSGARFYRSCRGAKDFVDRVNPVWHLPESMLMHIRNMTATAGNQGLFLRRGGTSANLLLEFCRIEEVHVGSCETDYIKTVILPQIAAVGGVGRLVIFGISDSGVQLLIAAAKPKTVVLWDKHNDPTSATYENIKNLHIHVHPDNLESYWRTEKLFQLAKNRKSISLRLYDSSREIIARFIENWLKGEKTGTLERLTVIPNLRSRTADELKTIRKEMEDLMKGHIKTEEGYIVERGGLDRLRIAVNLRTLLVDFYFS